MIPFQAPAYGHGLSLSKRTDFRDEECGQASLCGQRDETRTLREMGSSGQMTIFVLVWLTMAGNRVINATEFKAKCLAILAEIEQGGVVVTVTKRGRPVAVLGPAPKKPWKSPMNSFAGKGRIISDIVNVDMSGLWDVVRKK
jgi:prevent-host-death family protein